MSLDWLLSVPAWRGALVLAYHRILGEDEPRFDAGLLSATTESLAAQMSLLLRHFELVGPEQILPNLDAPGRRVVITFDDGYRDNYELAFPVLRDLGVPATFFLATGFIDEPRVPWWDELAWIAKRARVSELPGDDWFEGTIAFNGDRSAASAKLSTVYKRLPTGRAHRFLDHCADVAGTGRCEVAAAADLWMTWDMAREMRDAGMTIGGHTVTHPLLANTEPEAQARELDGCAARLREELDVPMRFFAYPVGLPSAFDATSKELVSRAGAELGFSLYGGYVRRGQRLDPFDVPRASVALESGLDGFRRIAMLPRFFARA